MEFKTTEEAVKALVAYGIKTGLIVPEEAAFAANSILDALKYEPIYSFTVEDIQEKTKAEARDDKTVGEELEAILAYLIDDAAKRGIIEDGIASRDLFDTRLMGCITPRPGEFLKTFREKYANDPKEATDYFYKVSCDSDYIRRYRIARDRKWIAPTKYGDLDITINLSKPEKDPKAIAAALKKKTENYPNNLLCHENEGYAGRLDHPARQTIRQLPMTLGGEKWFMQYSPYVYYNEHCIVLSGEHVPMKIEKLTFVRLLEFLQAFPHYTVGSNADLPIVGGSILTHEHFQGGNYTFAMAKAPIREEITFEGFEDIKAGIVNWPMSVIRLDGKNPERIVELSDKILTAWRGYSDPEADILAETDGTPHNTITPIARMRGDDFEMDLVLRNNRTTDEYPLGIFHPHQELHHIKKENIGLIEVMGLAVLPARLLGEMEDLKKAVLSGDDLRSIEHLAPHADWVDEFKTKYDTINAENIDRIVEDEIGIAFSQVLENAGVYKDTEAGNAAFRKFAAQV